MMWKKPWGYKEGLLCGAGLVVTGFLLQAAVGPVRWELFAWPVNGVALAVYLLLLAAAAGMRRRVYCLDWLSRYAAAVASLGWVVLFTVVMGLVRQVPSGHAATDMPGFSDMLSCWPFVLLYIWMATVLGLVTLRVSFPLRAGRIPFLLNHLGLLVVLLSATLGSADMQRLKMVTSLGKAEWRAATESGKLQELPLAIELEDFRIDEYPPKLLLIDNETGRALPEDAPRHLLLEEGVQEGSLQDWDITVLQSVPQAASVATEDTVRFTAFHSRGATYAVYLKARNRISGRVAEGWVSCGSFAFPYKALRLDEAVSLVMPDREPERFVSAVTVYTQSGKTVKDSIEVNRPLHVEGWDIYQLSYDESRGRWSETSVFELVRDPWLPVVYVGIGMMAAGAVCLFVMAQKRRKEDEV